ncbi:oxidoreductase, short chain dehydrogenase/reductase family [Corynebacterium simulans]|uniref:Oxidoreductase, short chain dehydrogenase/reductase family n=1 Tax=Corynebacterium simulans TaxID=146827 RepID=A0ABR5VCI0_9CORY|nr:oxidoreductase, short chain dehydrogenase/reductase family [Corynebacterium simulans]AMO91494.1 oxidoreductase, short chain dehydrogenase/reductase family [Corynebacterium simulans]KXU19118.1 oxidoreductase, short chain dehydrogenase/reductase family [Corynebacterium simulans]
MRGLTQVTARDLADDGITVNAYAPGIVKTPLMKGLAEELAENAGKPAEVGLGAVHQGHFLGTPFRV